MMKIPTLAFLEQRKATIRADLLLKVEADDWHGVADCAMDLREVEAQMRLVQLSAPAIVSCEHEWWYDARTDRELCMKCHDERRTVKLR